MIAGRKPEGEGRRERRQDDIEADRARPRATNCDIIETGNESWRFKNRT
jgi:hypothetical protein